VSGPPSGPSPTASTVPGVTTAHPSYDELVALPAYATQAVPTAFEDINGHLNIRHYVGIASEGLDESLLDVGITQNWPTMAGHGVFSAEHHMTYLSELRTGDKISARVRLIGRSERAAHVVVYLVDDSHQQVSYVMEEIFLHIDMASRRTAPWPDDVAAALDSRLEADAALAWQPTLSGSMALR
jgi:acyl-CoA thioester hydrolase